MNAQASVARMCPIGGSTQGQHGLLLFQIFVNLIGLTPNTPVNHRHRTRLNALLGRDPETLFILWISDMHVKVRFTRIMSLQTLIHPPWLTPYESIHRLFMIDVSDHVRLTRDVRGASWRYPGEDVEEASLASQAGQPSGTTSRR